MTHKALARLTRAIESATPRGLFGPRSLAAYLDVDVATTLRWLAEGRLPWPVEVDSPTENGSLGIYRWTRASIDNMIALAFPGYEVPTEAEVQTWREAWVCEDLASRIWANELNHDDNAAHQGTA